MPVHDGRLGREFRTLSAMVLLHCRGRHAHAKALCPECRALLDYARERLERCPFKEDKPTCAKCPVHCYKPELRERVREAMRWSGPRMPLRHPVLALRHWLDGRARRPRKRS